MRAVRPAPVVLIDCFREGLNTPAALSRALRSLDGLGHRLVRIPSADPKDTPMTAAVALALGADSVVVPVAQRRGGARRQAPRARTRARARSTSGPSCRTTSPRCRRPASSSSASRQRSSPRSSPRRISSWPRPPISFWPRAASRRSRASPRCRRSAGRRASRSSFSMMLAVRGSRRRIGSSDSISESPTAIGARRARTRTSTAQNARLAEFKRALRGGAKSIGQVVCAASPAVAAAYIAAGVDWVWIEWQHACQDAAVVARAGGRDRSARRPLRCANGGRARQGRHPAMPRCRRRYGAGPVHQYRGGGEGVESALPVRAPGDRVWNGSTLSRAKKSAVMFQLETSACIDALEEICRQPEMEFGDRRTWRPGHVDGAADARFNVWIHEGGRAQVVLHATSWRPAPQRGKSPADSRAAATHRACCRTALRWSALSHDLLDAMVGAQSIMTGAVQVRRRSGQDRARPHATQEVVAKHIQTRPDSRFHVLDGDSRRHLALVVGQGLGSLAHSRPAESHAGGRERDCRHGEEPARVQILAVRRVRE